MRLIPGIAFEQAIIVGSLTSPSDETWCYRQLVAILHPDGLSCPHCGCPDSVEISAGRSEQVPDHRCLGCRRSFNAWTGTILQGTSCPPSELLGELMSALRRISRRCETDQPLRQAETGSTTGSPPGFRNLRQGEPVGVRPVARLG
jgi:hypothetical protein